jgi:DNA-binding CsgD family transcriptional regulator
MTTTIEAVPRPGYDDRPRGAAVPMVYLGPLSVAASITPSFEGAGAPPTGSSRPRDGKRLCAPALPPSSTPETSHVSESPRTVTSSSQLPDSPLSLLRAFLGMDLADHVLLVDATVKGAIGDPDGAGDSPDAFQMEIAHQAHIFLAFADPKLLEGFPHEHAAHPPPLPEVRELTSRRSIGLGADDRSALLPSLTDSETRLLRYLPTRLTAPEIARELYLSVNTVKTHIRHLYEKLEAHSRNDAIERARSLGLLPSFGET